MTANVMQGDRERCLEAGMDDYVPKPVRLEDLDAALRGWLPAPARDSASDGDRDAPAIDPVLLGRLAHLTGAGRDGELGTLIGLFLEDTPRRLVLLSQAAARGEAGALVEIGHALRGAAAHFGISELVDLCERLEQLARSGALGGAAEVVTDLDKAYARVRDTLGAIRAQAPHGTSAPHTRWSTIQGR